MLSGKNRLMLLIGLALPSAGHALGLGDIHVDSALNEPLVAEIDIVGATADELAGIGASVANLETFAHFGTERPAFLSTATFKVTQDIKGSPVLAVRSRDAFTEPLVDILVDLRWRSGELVRQYTLLLDPSKFPSSHRVAETLRPVTAFPLPTGSAASDSLPRKTAKIGAGATLRVLDSRAGAGLYRSSGAVSNTTEVSVDAAVTRRIQLLENRHEQFQRLLDKDQETLDAFQARLAFADKLPTETDASSGLPSARFTGLWITAAIFLAAAVVLICTRYNRGKLKLKPPGDAHRTQDPDSVRVAENVFVYATRQPPAADDLFLDVRSEEELLVQREEQQAAAEMRERAGLVARVLDDLGTESWDSSNIVEAADAGAEDSVNLLGTDQTTELPLATMKIRVADANAETVQAQAVTSLESLGNSVPEPAAPDETTLTEHLREGKAKPEYKPEDLETTVQHVQMPSKLHESVGFKERRTSLVDVLKKAIEREPDRSDLRMKLLETYYTAAAFNRQGFLDVVQKLERQSMSDADWDKIASMGRQIAPDNEIFAPDMTRSAQEDLTNCA